MEKTEKKNKFLDHEREKIVQIAQTTLWDNSDESNKILDYLRNQRGLSDDVIRKFKFGYCPGNYIYKIDILPGRIIMPLYDCYNNLISITTRNPFCKKEYQHWHESFDKEYYLYGLDVAKEYILKSGEAIVVEGQFDVTCLHSNEIKNTVGVLGSCFSIFHIILLSRLCNRIYVVLDPDKSGNEGIKRALDLIDLYRLDLYEIDIIPVTIPDKLDPDEFVLKNKKDGFNKLLKNSKGK